MEKTIAAISTPLGKGAISIVRMSGNKCLEIVKKVFISKNIDYNKIIPRMLYLGNFLLNDNTIEKCLMVYFQAPNSYTGEDLIEFQIHGGTILSQKVLNTLLCNGAVIAEPGEFTKTAFMNGKISLDEAESIIGEINAESESELKASLNLADGKLKQKVKELQNGLTESIAQIEATLDYPEEDFEKSAKNKIFNDLKSVKDQINILVNDSQYAKYIKNGINVAIIGSPNVGKSSLLNALIGENRAIVTEIAGTTRDVLTESISYNGIKINFIDTAGIRNSDDTVEKLGIEKSKESIFKSDLILLIFDGSRNLNDSDKEILSIVENQNNILTIVNKIDKKRILPKQNNEIEVSALKEKNIIEIKNQIYKLVVNEEIDYNKTIIINERQIAILNTCKNIIDNLFYSQEESMDIISMLIKNLWNELGKITGECENEKIIDLIFSKFCLGK